jgi:signal transduction histidine kinase
MTSPDSAPPQAPVEQALRERIAVLERELSTARKRLRHLEDLDRTYTDLALGVSHELRTPLTLISAYAQKLLLRWTTTDDERRLSMVDKINVSSRRLARLVDDMLLSTDVELGELPLHIRSVAVREVVARAIDEMRERYTEGLPALDTVGDDLYARADGFRLEQVLICLLDNAVKHSGAYTTVTVTWRREGDRVVIAVTDQGGGISPADMPRLFQRFGRVQRTLSQSVGGMGLGLYIARRLTEAMDGCIWAESEHGHGSTFYIAIPASE